MFPQQVVVAAPHQFVIPSHMGPPASNPVQQMPTQMATPQMPQHHSSQVLSVILYLFKANRVVVGLCFYDLGVL